MSEPTPSPSSPGIRQVVWRYRFLFIAVVLISLGVILEVVFWTTHTEEVRDFAIAFLIAGTAGLGLELYTRREFLKLIDESLDRVIANSVLNTKLDDLKKLSTAAADILSLGIKRIYRNRLPIQFTDFIDQAEAGSDIRILGICLMSLTEPRIQRVLEEKLEGGCRIKILLLDPESRSVEERAADEGRDPNEVRAEIQSCERIHQLFVERVHPKNLRGNIELGYYDRYPGYFLLVIHSLAVVGFYLRGNRGEDCPAMELEVRGGGLSDSFVRHFDAAWETRKRVLGPELPFRSSKTGAPPG